MGARKTITLLLAIAGLATACAPPSTPTPRPDYVAELVRTVERDSIEAVVEPAIVVATAAEAAFDPTEPVLAVTVNGESRAYSVAQLGIHEVVNDTLGGKPIAVTW
jgi:hypothetical protein